MKSVHMKSVNVITVNDYFSLSGTFHISSPVQYAGMSLLEVISAVDWTEETTRDNYQTAISEAGGAIFLRCHAGPTMQYSVRFSSKTDIKFWIR